MDIILSKKKQLLSASKHSEPSHNNQTVPQVRLCGNKHKKVCRILLHWVR